MCGWDMSMPIVIRPNTYNVAMHGVPYGMLAIVLAFTLSVLAQSQNEEVTHVPPIAPAAVYRAFQEIYRTPPTLPLIPNSPPARRGDVPGASWGSKAAWVAFCRFPGMPGTQQPARSEGRGSPLRFVTAPER